MSSISGGMWAYEQGGCSAQYKLFLTLQPPQHSQLLFLNGTTAELTTMGR